MTLTELEEKVPALKEYTKTMPPEIRSRCTVRTHAAGSIIHQKDMELNYFGIVATGENRVINEFENGNVYMIEGNKAIDFIGEVTIQMCIRDRVHIDADEIRLISSLQPSQVPFLIKGSRPAFQDYLKNSLRRHDLWIIVGYAMENVHDGTEYLHLIPQA